MGQACRGKKNQSDQEKTAHVKISPETIWKEAQHKFWNYCNRSLIFVKLKFVEIIYKK